MGNRPGNGDGVPRIDVLVHGDDQFSHAIAVVEDALHCVPRLLIIALLQTDNDVGAEIDQGLHEMDVSDGIQTPVNQKPFNQSRHAHRFDLRTFTRRDLADDRNPNGAFAVGDAFQFENRA